MNAEILMQLEKYEGDQAGLRFELAEYLRSLGVDPTEQYVEVLHYLYTHRTHPTVDEIFKALYAVNPLFSRSRIYSVLDILSRAGAIQVIRVDKHHTHYDGITTPHAHFICRQCGKIEDAEIFAEIDTVVKPLQGFSVYDVQIMCLGECRICRITNVN